MSSFCASSIVFDSNHTLYNNGYKCTLIGLFFCPWTAYNGYTYLYLRVTFLFLGWHMSAKPLNGIYRVQPWIGYTLGWHTSGTHVLILILGLLFCALDGIKRLHMYLNRVTFVSFGWHITGTPTVLVLGLVSCPLDGISSASCQQSRLIRFWFCWVGIRVLKQTLKLCSFMFVLSALFSFKVHKGCVGRLAQSECTLGRHRRLILPPIAVLKDEQPRKKGTVKGLATTNVRDSGCESDPN